MLAFLVSVLVAYFVFKFACSCARIVDSFEMRPTWVPKIGLSQDLIHSFL